MERLKCVKAKTGNIITPMVRLMWCRDVLKPGKRKGAKPTDDEKYSTGLLIPKAADLTLLKEAIDEAAVDKFGEKGAATIKPSKKPFKRTEDIPQLAELADEYPVFLNCSAKQKPKVVDNRMNEVIDEEQIYSGRWAKVSLNAYAWEHAEGGKGVSLGLNNIQLFEHDEQLAGGRASAEDEFEEADIENGDGEGSASSVFD